MIRLAVPEAASVTFILRLWTLYIHWLSKPASDRLLYRCTTRSKAKKIVEMGLGNGQRAGRLIALAALQHETSQISYTGIDLFEGRPGSEQPTLTLKQTYSQLKKTGAQIRLVPGGPHEALSRTANSLTETDVLVISADQDAGQLAKAWFYVPRMLKPTSQVLVEVCDEAGQVTGMRILTTVELEALAAQATLRRKAA